MVLRATMLLRPCLLLGVLVTLATQSSAQTNAVDRATAQALFDEGKKLMRDGQAAAACPKLEESLELDAAIGTRYQLAKCYELTARTASAWTLYLEVAAEARAAGQAEREEFARSEAGKLEPTLSHLTIIVPDEARVPGLGVSRNGVPVGKGGWGTKLPVDPGRYSIVARAPGKRAWEGVVDVRGPKGAESIVIPKLSDAPVQPTGPAQSGADKTPTDAGAAAPEAGLSTQHWVGVGLAGAGVLSLAASGILGLSARSKDQDSNCNPTCLTEQAQEQNEEARRLGNIATITGIAGGALLIGGAVVFLTAAPPKRETVVLPSSVGTGLGLTLHRSF